MNKKDVDGKKFKVKKDFISKTYATPYTIKKGEVWTGLSIQYPTGFDKKTYVILLKGNNDLKVPENEFFDKFDEVQVEANMKLKEMVNNAILQEMKNMKLK